MSVSDRLKAAAQAAELETRRKSHPKGWEPGLSLTGDSGTITTEPVKGEPDWVDLLSVWGLDPTVYEVVGDPQVRAWDSQTKEGIERLFYYRANIRKRVHVGVDVDELARTLRKNRVKAAPVHGSRAFVFPLGDTQIGEWTVQGGTEYTLQRFLDVCDAAVAQLKLWRKQGKVNGDVYLLWLGDCIQGFGSQGGRLAWRTDATLTEQFRIFRRLLAMQVEMFAPLAERLVVASVAGNHDEAVRQPVVTRGDDSWAVEALVTVKDAFDRVEGYEHVSFVTPAKDSTTVTLDVAGTVVGLAHGHQWRGDAHNAHAWFAKQAHGRTQIGDAERRVWGRVGGL